MTVLNHNLLFGTAYYPEYMPYDRIEKDIKMMKTAGMNVIRIAESTWSTLEPQEGVFDFSYIDKILSATMKNGISVIIGTPTYAIPSWLAQKDADILVMGKDGRRKYGTRQIMDLTNHTFRKYAERVICELLKHTANVEHVIGFQIDNETKHYGTSGEGVQILFKEYLRNKFGTTQKLNETFGLSYWSNSISDFEDLPDMRGCINGGLAAEFEKFQRKIAADYLIWQSDIVKKYKREEQFITHNFDFEWKKFGADIAQDGYSYGVQPDINHLEASEAVTIAGTDIYHPTQDHLTGAEIAFGGDSIRSLKRNNYYVLECQAQAFKYWTPYPGQLRLHAYSHLASGADSVMYWNWHSIHSGYETYWKGLLSHDLDINPTYEEACKIGNEWKRISSDLVHLKKKNKVALVIDNLSLTAFKWFPIDKNVSYNDVVRWAYDSLFELNIECDVVDINALDCKQYEMIITPALYAITEENLYKLDAFVRNGGVLISTFKSFVADEFLKVYHEKQPHILYQCFGMSYNQFTEPGKIEISGHQVTGFAELLKLESANAIQYYEHKYWGEYAGITEQKYGEGMSYYIGCFTDKEVLKDIYRKAIANTSMLGDVYEFCWPVIARNGINEKEKKLHYLFNYSQEEQSIKCPYESVKELLTEKVFRKGDVIILHDWDVKIFREE